MWERTLKDLIRGLRANKKDEAKFISQAIDEIRQEIKSKDMELKAGAVLKLTYLDMMGYDMSWAAFHVVEVMSSPKIHLKTIGYLAATQSFTQETDVLMLTTNLLKKDLGSRPEEVAITLNGLAHIATPDLGRDLSRDLIAMLNHSRPTIRKRAVLALYKVFLQYPDSIPQGIGRMKEKLEDPDPGVIAAAVNALCELVESSPTDYLTLAPPLFHLLTTSNNNWMLIKVIKIFAMLAPYELRLVKKLQPALTELISSTPAISVLYECVRACITGGMLQGSSGSGLARTCVTKLAAFLQDPDQNLKYIALLAMVRIVPTHPELVAEYQDMIVSSVDDQDISIRMRALDLLSAMVSRHNLQTIVQQLLSHLLRSDSSALPSAAQSLAASTTANAMPKAANAPSQSPAYRLTLSQRIIALCSQNTYENVTDFEWYLSVLVDLAYIADVDIGADIRDQLIEVVTRVRGARPFAVQLMAKFVRDDSFLLNASETGSCAEVLWAAAFICGEYCGELADPERLLAYLLQPGTKVLDPETITVYLQAALKVFGYWSAELAGRWDDEADLPRVKNVVETIAEGISQFVSHSDLEVQERAANIIQLFSFIRADVDAYKPKGNDADYGETSTSGFDSAPSEPSFPKSLYLIRPLFDSYELNAVAPHAQSRVPLPDGLDLDAWIIPPPVEASNGFDEDADEIVERKHKGKKGKGKDTGSGKSKEKKKSVVAENGTSAQSTPEEIESEEARAGRERRRQERLERMRDDPYYLVDDRPSSAKQSVDVDAIPVVRLDDLPPLSQASSKTPSLRNSPAPTPQTFVVDRTGEMPEGATPPASTPLSLSASGRISLPRSQGGTPSSSYFPAYQVEDEVPRTGTPPPIKVTRAKKKGTSSGKKKRTHAAESASPLVE